MRALAGVLKLESTFYFVSLASLPISYSDNDAGFGLFFRRVSSIHNSNLPFGFVILYTCECPLAAAILESPKPFPAATLTSL